MVYACEPSSWVSMVVVVVVLRVPVAVADPVEELLVLLLLSLHRNQMILALPARTAVRLFLPPVTADAID